MTLEPPGRYAPAGRNPSRPQADVENQAAQEE